MTKKVNQAGAGATQTATDATTNVGKIGTDAVKNVKNTTDSAVGNLADTATNTGKAIGNRDIKGVGAGIAKGSRTQLSFELRAISLMTYDRYWQDCVRRGSRSWRK